MNSIKTYSEFSLNLSESNTVSYHKYIQSLYKIIKEVDTMALIVKYKLDKGKEEIIEKNKVRVRVLAKNTLLNYIKVVPNYLW